MPVIDVAQTDVMTAHRDQTAGNLATVMSEEGVGCVIIEEDSHPVGIVTDRDLVLEVLEPRLDPADVTAGDIMTETVATIDENRGVFEATKQMHTHSVRRIPVIDSNNDIVGIVTLDDLVVLLARELANLSDVIEAEFPDSAKRPAEGGAPAA